MLSVACRFRRYIKAFLVWVYMSKVETTLQQDRGTEEQAAIGTLTPLIVSSHLSVVLFFSCAFSLLLTAACNYSISHFVPQRHISTVCLQQARTRCTTDKSWSLFLTLFSRRCQNITSMSVVLLVLFKGPASLEMIAHILLKYRCWIVSKLKLADINWQQMRVNPNHDSFYIDDERGCDYDSNCYYRNERNPLVIIRHLHGCVNSNWPEWCPTALSWKCHSLRGEFSLPFWLQAK